MPRVIVVTTSPRLPGLLSAAGWAAVAAGPVYVVGDEAQLWEIPVVAVSGPAEFLQQIGDHAVLLGGDAEFVAAVRACGAEVETVVGSADPPGARLLQLIEVMDRLRRECPWDSQQTHESLKSYLLEEAYEAYDALQDGDPVALREELGDVLFQVFFHSRLAEESAEPWTVDDVAGDLVDKLIRRHPHVFDGLEVSGADEVNLNWDRIKRAEKQRDSIFDGVPESLPALILAETLQRKAIRAGLPEELLPTGSLFVQARDDAESALRLVAREFRAWVVAAEVAARDAGIDSSTMDAETWRRYWPNAAR